MKKLLFLISLIVAAIFFGVFQCYAVEGHKVAVKVEGGECYIIDNLHEIGKVKPFSVYFELNKLKPGSTYCFSEVENAVKLVEVS